MSERWYLPFYGRGRPIEVIQRVTKLVHDYDLADTVPRMCVERRRQTRNVEFYFFLGINSEAIGKVPPGVELILDDLARLGYHSLANKAVTFDQIKKMTGGELDITTEFTSRIAYRPSLTKPVEDPLSYFTEQYREPTASSFAPFNHLLYWLTATGHGPWGTFVDACERLLPDESRPPRQLFRRFRMLGHVEYVQQGEKWAVAPSCLVQVDNVPSSSEAEYYLAGQRNIEIEQLVNERAKQSMHLSHSDPSAPVCLRFTFPSQERAVEILRDLKALTMAGNASVRLAEALPSITNWKHSLRSIKKTALPTGLYYFEKWENDSFVEQSFVSETGLYHLKRRDVSSGPELTLFYDEETSCWLRADWYGLRYLAQKYEEQDHTVYYYPTASMLAIPMLSRWPDIYERSLTLASGLLPSYKEGWLYFSNVSERLCDLLASKLSAIIANQEE